MLKVLLLVFTAAFAVTIYTQFANVEEVSMGTDAGMHATHHNKSLADMNERELMGMLLADAKRIDLFIQSIQKIPQDIANLLTLQKFSLEEITIIQKSILENSPELNGMSVNFEANMFIKEKKYFSSYLYRKNGQIIQTNLNDPAYDYFSRDWYMQPKERRKAVWISPYHAEGGTDILMTTYAVPFNIFDGKKESFAGVITVDVSIDWLVDYFPKNKILPRDGVITLISADGTILCARNKEWVVKETIFSLSEKFNLPDLKQIGREIQQGKHGVRKIYSENYNQYIEFYYTTIKTSGWGLLYLIPEAPISTADNGLMQDEKESAKERK